MTTVDTDVAQYDTDPISPGHKLSHENSMNSRKENSQLYIDTPTNVITALHRDNQTFC